MTDVDMTASRRALLAGALGAGGLSMVAAGPASGLPLPTQPGSDFYLDVEDIPGESQRDGYEDLLEPLTWSFGAEVDAAGGSGRRRSAPVLADFVVVNRLSKASPKLFDALLKGMVLKTMTLHAVLSGGNGDGAALKYLEVELKNVQLVAYDLAPGEQDGYPLEVVRSRYEEIKVTYWPLNNEGGVGDPITMSYQAPKRA